MQHKTILAQGGTVHYWISRKENAAECIVFTHRITADHTMFERQVSYFSDNCTVILWDVPRHGLSRPYQKFSYRDTADILHSILRRENIAKVFMAGMSMGGYPSQHFADTYPDMVKGLAASGTTPLGLRCYSKSDLRRLKQAAPMAKCFSTNILRKSMARSVSGSRYSYRKMPSMLKPPSKAEIIEQMRIAYEDFLLENKDSTGNRINLLHSGKYGNTDKNQRTPLLKCYCSAALFILCRFTRKRNGKSFLFQKTGLIKFIYSGTFRQTSFAYNK